ncbi:MAG: hypothetical protein ACFWT2_12280 [Thermoanaerobacterium thermosaccharolyticum]|jgi:TRAP-type C4-dicarboxylate transport system permease small subunit
MLKKVIARISAFLTSLYVSIQVGTIKALAAQDGTTDIKADVSSVTNNIENSIKAVAMPIGGLLIFLSVVLVAIRIIVSHYNPNKRSEALGGLMWVALGSAILGASFLIAGWIISVTTGGTGSLLTK